jgi:hypothetical protein
MPPPTPGVRARFVVVLTAGLSAVVALLSAVRALLPPQSPLQVVEGAQTSVEPASTAPADRGWEGSPGLWAQLKELDAVPELMEREERICRFVASVPEDQIRTVLDECVEAEGDSASAFAVSLVRRWAENEPLAAAAWALELRHMPVAELASREVAWAWSESDLGSALAWARRIPNLDQREVVLLALGYEAARQDPAQATEIASELRPGPERQDLLVYATGQWAGLRPEEALGWLWGADQGRADPAALAVVAVGASESVPELSLRMAIEKLSAGERQNRSVIAILQRWAQQDPESAADWVARFPTEPLGRIAVRNLVDIWSEQGWDAPAQWLAGLHNQDLRETGAHLLRCKQALGGH